MSDAQEQHGEPSPPADQVECGRALRAFLNNGSWEETRAVLEREQALLLTRLADQLLSAAMDYASQSADPQVQARAAYLELHRTLLRRSRTLGIPAAWAEFEAYRQAAEAAPASAEEPGAD
jgi:hypothetical protein